MLSISARLRRLVIRRAQDCCEYCRIAQIGQEATFHIDHVLPTAHGGNTEETNLALACVSCSLRKGSRQSAIDPQTGKKAALFHPRLNKWNDHFRWDDVMVEGITPMGRATVKLLKLNRPSLLAIRQEEALLGRFPPVFDG